MMMLFCLLLEKVLQSNFFLLWKLKINVIAIFFQMKHNPISFSCCILRILYYWRCCFNCCIIFLLYLNCIRFSFSVWTKKENWVLAMSTGRMETRTYTTHPMWIYKNKYFTLWNFLVGYEYNIIFFHLSHAKAKLYTLHQLCVDLYSRQNTFS